MADPFQEIAKSRLIADEREFKQKILTALSELKAAVEELRLEVHSKKSKKASEE